MNKLYPCLHNVNSNFKKRLLSISLLLFLTLHIGTNANAQCNNSNSSGTISAPSPGNTVQINACAWAGDYSTINSVTATTSYTVTSSIGTDFFTIRQGTPGGPVIAFGTTPLTWTSASAGTYYSHINTNTGCGTQNTCRITAITNNPCVPPVVMPNPAFMCLGDPAVKLKVVSAPTTAQFCSGPLNIAVPDNNAAGVSNSIVVSGIPATCPITNISVTINMPHTYPADMVINLRGPNGQILSLYKHNTNTDNGPASIPTAGFYNAVVNNTSTVAFVSVPNPYRYGQTVPAGPYRPDALNGVTNPGYTIMDPTGFSSNASNFVSLYTTPASMNGNWTLAMADGAAGDLGTLISWCLGITYSCTPGIPSMPAVWSPAAGLFSNAVATIPYVAGTAVDSVWARPLPVGTYTYAVTTSGSPAPPIAFTNPAAITIPVGGPATAYPSNLTVSGLPITGVTIRSITLHNISHTRSGDIDVLLQSPTGQNLILMSDAGGSNGIINATYTFTDGAPAMSITAANPTGTYKPTNSIGAIEPDNFPAPGPGTITQPLPTISMLTPNYNGAWKLFVIDDDGTGDQGVISGGYTISFYVPLCFSPPTYVVVNVGLPISITAQPVNKTICTDGVATFSVTAAGAGTLNYQWQVSSNAGGTYTDLVNGGVYSGVTTATLTVTAPPVSMSGFYYRVIINGSAACATATSAAAILTVNPLPVVVISANPLILSPGMTTTIFSTVTPNPAATYTWYYNGAVLPGATADTVLVDINGLGDYQLKVTDVNGCANLSNIITIVHSFALTLFTYPNPSGGIFQVRYYSEANNAVQRSLTVYNNRGEKIITRTFTQTIPYQKIDVDIRAHGKGLYWIELRDAAGKRLAINRAVVQ